MTHHTSPSPHFGGSRRGASLLRRCFLALTAFAQQRPSIKSFSSTGYIFGKMSANGQWVTQYQEVEATTTSQLINLTTYAITDLQTKQDISLHGVAAALAVTNDGNIVVGSYENCPAFLDRTTGKWTKLSSEPGQVRAVTPDGHYAVGLTHNGGGSVSEVDWYTMSWGKMWDLTTGTEVTLGSKAIPAADPKGNKNGMVGFVDVSADGRYILGYMFVDYPDYAFLIDREANDGTGAFTYIAYKKGSATSIGYEPLLKGLYFLSPQGMSPNAKWIVCNGYFVQSPEEYYAPVRYNIETGAVEAFNASDEDRNILCNVIDNDGNIYGGAPMSTAAREFYIRSGKYWYSLRSLLAQRYGMDFTAASGLDNTGTPYSISDDGMTFTAMVDPQFGQNMVMKMNERLVDVCKDLKLLGAYTASPEAGTSFSRLSQIRLTFTRSVEVIGAQTAATFGSWQSLSGNGIYVDPTDSKTVVVAFRSRDLEADKTYDFHLPAGTVCVAGDSEQTNTDITIQYKGRASAPVRVVSVYPEDGSTTSKLDYSSSPVMLTMDCDVLGTDTASAWVETTAEGKRVCDLVVAYNGTSVMLFPPTTQYLLKDVDYTVALGAGSLTDLMGGGANERWTMRLRGSYEREVDPSDAIIFKEDFNVVASSIATWMLYEGDHRNPITAMTELEFDKDNTPWNFSIHETLESADYCAASHSLYSPSGQSHDWMVSPQIFIPDALCRLSFQAQSYRKAKQDRLKVIILATDDQLSSIDEATYNRILSEGDLVADTLLTPGDDEEMLSGEWQDISLSLSAYAGKNIYLCFGNENRAQSMVFVDNIVVSRDLPFIITVTSPDCVENLGATTVSGRLDITDKTHTYSSVALSLLDSEGKTISRLSAEGLSLKAGDHYDFTFADQLPLRRGETVAYTIELTLDGVTNRIRGTVDNLTFTPTKRVVLEEMTGTTCGNCPQGILAISQMERLYGNRFIPVSIHTYTGDIWGNGLDGYTTYLGLYGAPTAVIQRSTDACMPMTTDESFRFTFSHNGELWMDRVAVEMEKATPLAVSAKVNYNETTREFTMPVEVTSALNIKNMKVNVFAVLLEDSLVNLQHNYFSNNPDPLLGDWGRGGKYGMETVRGYVHNDVVRTVYSSSYAGTPALLPQQAAADEVMVCELEGELTDVVENPKNAKMVVMLIDADTERIINACVAYIDPSRYDGINSVTATDSHATRTYNLQGQEVNAATYRGVAIRNGKVIVTK